MPEDGTKYGSRRPPEPIRSSGDPESPPIRWPDDDSPWPSSDDFLRERRVDRQHRSSSRGAAGRGEEHRRSSSREASGRRERPSRPRKESRSRVVAVVVLVLAAVTIAITGMETKTSLSGGTGSENAVPFSLLPITRESVTSTTTSATSTSTTATTITSTTAAAADGGSVENIASVQGVDDLRR